MQSIQLKAGLLTALVVIALVSAIMLLSGSWMLFLGYWQGSVGSLNRIVEGVMLAALVSPFVFFIGWAVFDLASGLYSEMLDFMNTKRRKW